nr:50S ribosomal protein L23 [Methanothermus fervidus]
MDPHKILIRPHVTEKTMDLIDNNNELVFVVNRKSNKPKIKAAFEELFSVKVERVNTHINPKGEKIAYIKLAKEHKAEDIAMKLGIL